MALRVRGGLGESLGAAVGRTLRLGELWPVQHLLGVDLIQQKLLRQLRRVVDLDLTKEGRTKSIARLDLHCRFPSNT